MPKAGGAFWVLAPPEELCSYCFTGHGPEWMGKGPMEPEWVNPKRIRRFAKRLWRSLHVGPRSS
jgi:hypothetical protein